MNEPKGMGWIRDTEVRKARLNRFLGQVMSYALPQSADLRKFASPVKDQGDLGSCTSFMATGALEFCCIALGLPYESLSELFIYYNERVRRGTVDEDSGASIGDAYSVMASPGACHETMWPYDISKFRKQPPYAAYANAALHVAIQQLMIYDGNLLSIKQAHAAGYAVGLGFDVYESFQSIGSDGLMPVPRTGRENYLGGHAVLSHGYDDEKKCLIIKNSWGPDWGDKGYFYMPYEYVQDRNGYVGDIHAVQALYVPKGFKAV